jgi:glycosyltransferase involved in cell wall biosynthesis
LTIKKILFYSSVRSKKQFVRQEFYRTDIRILRSLGYHVLLSKHWYDFFAFWKYDCAFIYFYRFGLIPAVLARIFFKRVYFTGGIDYLNRQNSTFKEWLIQSVFYNLCGLLSTSNIIVSEADLRNCNKVKFLFPAKKQILCKHSINEAVFLASPDPAKEKLVVTIAWMERPENVVRKGLLESLELFSAMVKKDSAFRMLIIGSKGAGSGMVEARIQQLGLAGHVSLTDGVTEDAKVLYLKQALVYLQLSKYEGFGIAAIEALLARCLVVHSGAGGLAEGVGSHGILWRDGQNAPVVDEVLELLSSAKSYNARVVAGRKHVLANYSLAARANAFRSIITGN